MFCCTLVLGLLHSLLLCTSSRAAAKQATVKFLCCLMQSFLLCDVLCAEVSCRTLVLLNRCKISICVLVKVPLQKVAVRWFWAATMVWCVLDSCWCKTPLLGLQNYEYVHMRLVNLSCVRPLDVVSVHMGLGNLSCVHPHQTTYIFVNDNHEHPICIYS